MFTNKKSHGKWGDLIIAIGPILWCANILSNSNFLLKLAEWQTENCIYNLRIRGKQWYWVYKFDTVIYDYVKNIRSYSGRKKKQKYFDIWKLNEVPYKELYSLYNLNFYNKKWTG